MTDDSPKRRGRPVSAEARAKALDTAAALLLESGWSGFSIDEVARRSRVSKATIYRHWPSTLALAMEAFGRVTTDEVPTRTTGDVVADLEDQVVRLGRFYASREGGIIAQLLGAAIGDPAGARLVREQFFAPRRQATRDLIAGGQDSGQLRADVDAELMIDMLFGPIVFRLFNGLEAHTDRQNALMARVTLAAFRPGTPR